ncbi:MAG TPA: hypothetical protein VNA12_09450 [Mycobacteriales bacterium]|nr:hypothetical protein [Mycobacteriales bacterium]
MPDIVDLLNAAVPDIPSESDLDALARRAGELRRRQHALRALPALAVVLALSLVAVNRIPGEPDRLTPIPATEGSLSASPQPLTATLAPPAGSRPTPQATGTPNVSTGTAPVPGPAVTRPASTASSPRPAPSPTAFPAAESCRVDISGLEAGQSRSCSFTATAEGGYNMRQTGEVAAVTVAGENYRVDVTRGGRTSTHGYDEYAPCKDAVVEPGDQVTVTVYKLKENVTDFQVGAGEGYNCSRTSD